MYSTLHITDGAARSSTHSNRRSNNGLALQIVLSCPRGHATSWHSPSDLIASPRAKARLEAFCAALPLRKVASEEREYFGSVKKLDTSASSLATLYRTRFIGHKFELSGLLHAGLLPNEPRL